MTKILNANELEKCSEELVRFTISKSKKNRNPKLVILVASDDKASEVYVRNKVKMGEKFGIDVVVEKFAMFVKDEEIKEVIDELNNDDNVDGVMLQLPVYNHLDSEYLINQICPYKDVDGLTFYNKAALEMDKAIHLPCTPEGVVSLLQLEGVEIEGKNVVIIGRGETSGAPMATTFRNENATVTMCHSKTSRKDLEFYIRHADIVISCAGKRNMIEAEWLKEGSIAIGVGFTYDENGKQQLDFDVDKVVELGKADMVSQRTNCTGKATVVSLMCNTAMAYLRQL